MFKFLFFIFFLFILLVFLLGFSFIRMVTGFLFGGSKKQTYGGQQRRPSSNRATQQQSRRNTNDAYSNAEEYNSEPRYKRRPKIFSKDEGEYVDYEEIK